MAKTVIGLFDRFEQARDALDDLVASGFSREDLSIIMNEQTGRGAGAGAEPSRGEGGEESSGAAEGAASGAGVGAASGAVLGGAAGLLGGLGAIAIPGFGALLAAGPIVGLLSGAGIGAGVGAVAGGLIGALTKAGVPEEQANLYAQSVREGGTLLMLEAEDDEMADRAADIMDRHGAVDIEERAGMMRGGMAAGATEGAGAQTGATPGRTMEPRAGEVREGEIHEQVIQEQLRVGKREVGRGGVRVYARVTEQPVSEQVRLREEHVRVERRPADRPATPEELAAGQEEVVIRETAEEPVVQKEPRVVEEVVLSKEAEEHVEDVPGTVKRRDVEVERIPGQEAGMAAGAMDLEPEFRQHYQQEFTTGEQFEQVAPAYRYGSQLSADRRFQGRSWDEVRQDARSDWESRNPGTFDRIEGAIRYAYDRARGRGGGGGMRT